MKIKYFVVLLALFLSACASLGDRTVNVSETDVQNMLNKKLAVPIQLLKIFDVSLSNSIVKFDKQTGRMQTTLDTVLDSQLFGKSITGKLGISGKLRFDAASQSIVLDEPAVEQFNLDGAGDKYNEIFNSLAKTVGGQMLNGMALYTVKPEDLKFGGATYAPKDMQVTDQGLQITLSPQR
ncbi:MAG TPA: DUF1439 domain-containing protein [Methylotenera sp.]|nr:DUF1439 domain-containing protein [Methylotenera sp.]HPH04275.1 DUF1439 domain-containing protein [Methylotenera sp.]HPM99829.1 DUF1439 domain-containing protein [Methylotenera sp.]